MLDQIVGYFSKFEILAARFWALATLKRAVASILIWGHSHFFQVIVPVFGDQPANGQEAEIKGYGLSVSLIDLKADDLYNAIRYNLLLKM